MKKTSHLRFILVKTEKKNPYFKNNTDYTKLLTVAG